MTGIALGLRAGEPHELPRFRLADDGTFVSRSVGVRVLPRSARYRLRETAQHIYDIRKQTNADDTGLGAARERRDLVLPAAAILVGIGETSISGSPAAGVVTSLGPAAMVSRTAHTGGRA